MEHSFEKRLAEKDDLIKIHINTLCHGLANRILIKPMF